MRCIITLLLFSEECGFSMFLLTNRFFGIRGMGECYAEKMVCKSYFLQYSISFASYCMMQLFLDANPFTIGVNGIARNMFLFMIYYGVLLCLLSQNAPCIIVWWNIDDSYWRESNYLVLQFRGYGIIFMDFYAISTAMTVAGRYTVKIIPCLIAATAVAVLQIVAVCGSASEGNCLETAWFFDRTGRVCRDNGGNVWLRTFDGWC